MLKILLVDDEPIFRMGLRAGIQWEEMGCKVVGEAKNGEEALIQIEEKNPDLVLLDIKMPKMDGIEVLKRMKNRKQKPEFIVLSCFNEYEYVREAMKLGACDYLFKPLMEGKDIAAAVREISKNMDSAGLHEENQASQMEILMENLLTESEAEEEIVRSFQKVCPAVENMPYFVLTVKIPGEICNTRKKEALRTLCKSILVRCFDDKFPPYFCERDQVLYGLFFYKPEDGYSFPGKRKNLWKKVKEYVEVPVWVGCSKCMEKGENLKKAFSQAEKALNLHFFSCYSRTSEEFVEYSEKFSESRDFSVIYEKELRVIQKAFGEFDLHTVKNTLNKISDSVLQQKLFSEKDFSHMLANMIVSNMRFYKYRNLMEQLIVEDYDVISKLYHRETMEEACNYFVVLTERIFGMVKTSANSNSRSNSIQDAVEYMKEHYAEKISLADMSQRVNMSDKYFCKLFKEVTGETFVGYLTNIRIQAAREMLERTDMKTYEVAERAGFGDYHHFCKTFKKITGRTPTEIRAIL